MYMSAFRLKSSIVLIIENSKLNHLGVQATFNPSPDHLYRSWDTVGVSSLAVPLLLAGGYVYGVMMAPEPTVDLAATNVRFETGERTARLKK